MLVRGLSAGGGNGQAAEATTISAEASPTTTNTLPVTSSSASPKPTPPAPPGQADVSAVAGDPDAVAVGQTLSEYFIGVNGRDFDTAYAVFSPALRGRIGFEEWSSGLGTTTDSAVVVVGLERSADGAVLAQTRFTSEQSAENGPVAGQTCTNWTLTYTLVPNIDGPTAFQIDAVADVGPGHTAC
ncbi:MAG: hypothetical protein ACR2K3_14215 [Nocardioides sp.]